MSTVKTMCGFRESKSTVQAVEQLVQWIRNESEENRKMFYNPVILLRPLTVYHIIKKIYRGLNITESVEEKIKY